MTKSPRWRQRQTIRSRSNSDLGTCTSQLLTDSLAATHILASQPMAMLARSLFKPTAVSYVAARTVSTEIPINNVARIMRCVTGSALFPLASDSLMPPAAVRSPAAAQRGLREPFASFHLSLTDKHSMTSK